MEKCLYGLADIEELDDYVEYWHTHNMSLTLREFLGMSPREYEMWIKMGDGVIRELLTRRSSKASGQAESVKQAFRLA